MKQNWATIGDPLIDEILERIDLLRDIIGRTFDYSDHKKGMYQGSIWINEERIFSIFQKNILKYYEIDEQKFLDKIIDMDQQEIDVFLINAIKDAAKADYFLKYEKEW
jgi:hypothetical protein